LLRFGGDFMIVLIVLIKFIKKWLFINEIWLLVVSVCRAYL